MAIFDGKLSTSIKVIHEHFSPRCFRDIHISKFVILKMQVKVMTYNIHSGPVRQQILNFLSGGNTDVCIFSAFTFQNSHFKSLTLKMQVKIMEYNTRKGLILWHMPTSIKVTLMHFRQLLLFSRYSQFKIHGIENAGHGYEVQNSKWRHSMENTRLIYLMAIIMFALSLTVYEIFAKTRKM